MSLNFSVQWQPLSQHNFTVFLQLQIKNSQGQNFSLFNQDIKVYLFSRVLKPLRRHILPNLIKSQPQIVYLRAILFSLASNQTIPNFACRRSWNCYQSKHFRYKLFWAYWSNNYVNVVCRPCGYHHYKTTSYHLKYGITYQRPNMTLILLQYNIY